jgi:hypothetical protein
MRPITFQIILVVGLCVLVFGACAKSDVMEGSAAKQPVVASQSPAGSATSLPSNTGQVAATTVGAAVTPKIDVCGLLTSQEIQAVQGEPLKESKASASTESGFSISQCFFTLPTFNNSISLVITQKGDGSAARDPKEFWAETFDKEDDSDHKSEKERDRQAKNSGTKNEAEEEEGAQPVKITGVGDEAFWTGSRVGGALYVLKGNSYIRVSVGGASDQQTLINRSKALARFALKRL